MSSPAESSFVQQPNATATYTQKPTPSTPPTYSSDEAQAPYLRYKNRTSYWVNNGILQVPVAAPFTFGGDKVNSEIIQLSAPYGGMTIVGEVVRQLLWPNAPEPGPYEDNTTLLAWTYHFDSADDMVDSTKERTIGWLFIYAFKQPVTIKDGKFFVGATPFDTDKVQTFGGTFDPNLLSANGGSKGQAQ